MHPKDATLDALERIKANTVEKRLLNSRGLPTSTSTSMRSTGKGAGTSMYEGGKFAVCTDGGAKTLDCEPLLTGKSRD